MLTIPFDYSTLSPETAALARNQAAAIRAGLERQLLAVVEAGYRLANVKAALPHGTFSAWIASELGWSARTAEQYMLAATTYGENAQRVAYLPLRTLYRLSAPSIPSDVRQEVFDRVERGAPPTAADVNALLTAASAPKKAAAFEIRYARVRRQIAETAEAHAAEVAARYHARKAADIAAREAVGLIEAEMPDQLGALLALIRTAGTWRFCNELTPQFAVTLERKAGAA